MNCGPISSRWQLYFSVVVLWLLLLSYQVWFLKSDNVSACELSLGSLGPRLVCENFLMLTCLGLRSLVALLDYPLLQSSIGEAFGL
mmetsp:Transcript_9347/g.14154  ORF Transcript_9347/g.14154 Transcript_9347/m.14154 type:complete len:86 (-) Transcript_9347:10200-10457(-)